MNRKEFCEYFEIPYRTVTEWERGTRKMPDYVLRLLAYKIKMNNLAKGEDMNEEQGDRSADVVKRGKYGGTYAHKDIAFEFASAISPVFKLYLIKEFQRLKETEDNLKQKEWTAKRFLSKSNYLWEF